jgi:hypothetical protein
VSNDADVVIGMSTVASPSRTAGTTPAAPLVGAVTSRPRRQSVVLVFLASGAFEIVLALVVVHGAVSVEADVAEESGHWRVHFKHAQRETVRANGPTDGRGRPSA